MSKQVMWSILSIVMGGVLGLPAWADTPTFRQVSQVSPPAPLSVATVDRQAPGAPLVFTVAPRETTAEAQKVYAPIADYLTKSTGQKFAFQYTESWLEYQDRMRKGEYDLILDGPHFVGWRASTMGHVVLLKLPQKQVWVVVARKDNDRIKSMTNIEGRMLCAHEPPNFGTLILRSLFTNPARQPVFQTIHGWNEAFNGVIAGKCVATILPKTNLDKLDPDHTISKIVLEHEPYPNLAITAGPRINENMRARVTTALQSVDGRSTTAEFRRIYAKGEDFVPATASEYAKAGDLLRQEVGFWFN